MKCAVCGKVKKTVNLTVSRGQLLFGGFPVRYEYMCVSCDTRLAKKIDRQLARR